MGRTKGGRRVFPRSAFQVKKGDKVMFTSYAGSEVTVDGKDYLIMTEEDVLAIVS